MSFVFAALTPHNPVLVPALAAVDEAVLPKTRSALSLVANHIAAHELDTLFVITPHAEQLPAAFGLNLCPQYSGNFVQFGDLATSLSVPGDMHLAYKTREYIETKKPFSVFSQELLDYGTAVVVVTLLGTSSACAVIPISISGASIQEHYEFGMLLRKQADMTSRKVGVVATTHLSHRLDASSPSGAHAAGSEFDSRVQQHLVQKTGAKKLLDLDERLVANAQPCGFPALFVLLGMISQINHKPSIIDYEVAFGIGHITALFDW